MAEPQPKAAPQSLPRGRRKRRHETESDDLPAVLQEAGPGPARKRAGLTPAEMQRLVKGVRWEKESQQEYLARSLPSVSGVSATLGPDIFVFGRVECEGHLDLHGVVQGELQCESLSIAPEGKVEGSIVAQQVWIGGVIDGPVTADTVTLAKTARVNGSIFHRELHMEPGARHRGRKPWRLHPLENR